MTTDTRELSDLAREILRRGCGLGPYTVRVWRGPVRWHWRLSDSVRKYAAGTAGTAYDALDCARQIADSFAGS